MATEEGGCDAEKEVFAKKAHGRPLCEAVKVKPELQLTRNYFEMPES